MYSAIGVARVTKQRFLNIFKSIAIKENLFNIKFKNMLKIICFRCSIKKTVNVFFLFDKVIELYK